MQHVWELFWWSNASILLNNILFCPFFFIDNSLLLVLYHSFLLRLKFHSNRMVDKRMAKITIFTLEKLSKIIECICHVPLLIFFEWLWSLCCKIWNTFFAAHRVAFKWICFTVIVGNPNDKKSIFNALSGFLWLAARWSKVSWFPFGQHFWYHKSCTNFFGFRNDSWSDFCVWRLWRYHNNCNVCGWLHYKGTV